MSVSSAVDATLVAVRDCRVSYGAVEALRGVDLVVGRRERVALVGPSGAGKSTLLRALYRAAPERCALVAQAYDLVPQLSVFANVDAGRLDQRGTLANLRNLMWPRRDDRESVETLLVELGLAGLARRRAGELSGGQKQRVAVARALHAGREVLLADEPVSAVDPARADAVLTSILERSETCVLAMHAMAPVLQACTRVVAMRDGRIAFDRPREAVVADDLQQFFDAG